MLNRSNLATWMRQNKMDILALQETYLADSKKAVARTVSISRYLSFSPDRRFQTGSNHHETSTTMTCSLHTSEPNCRFVIRSAQYWKFTFRLTAIYVPVFCKDRVTFLDDQSRVLSPDPQHNHRVCGDFKCVVNKERQSIFVTDCI